MDRKLAFAMAIFAFLFVACTDDPEQKPSTNINNPTHITQPDDQNQQVPADSTGTQEPADSTDTPGAVDPEPAKPEPQDDAVDLGLSVKWASCNIGATKPEDYGDYYAWAEIEPFYTSLDPLTWKDSKPDGYSWNSARWFGKYPNVTKYCPAGLTNCWDKEGDPDGKTVIDPDDDVATVTLGGAWRMPTEAEWNELESKCTWTWTAHDGVNGFEIAAADGNSIFLPAAGIFDAHDLLDPGKLCAYWSSSLNTNLPENAINLHHYSGYGFTGSTVRYDGCPIRPVKE